MLSFCQQQQRDQERAGVCRHGSVRRITVNNVQCCWEFPPSNSSESCEALRSQLSDRHRKKPKRKISRLPATVAEIELLHVCEAEAEEEEWEAAKEGWGRVAETAGASSGVWV